jgi:uncharacterized phage-associated protein
MLVFLAYNDGSPLFDEDVYAWPWRPLLFTVSFADLVGSLSTGTARRCSFAPATRHWIFHIQTPPPPRQETMKFLRRVWESHKGFTGVQLSNATHAEGEPWWIVKQQYGTLDSKPLIPNNLIYEVFRAKLPGSPAVANG